MTHNTVSLQVPLPQMLDLALGTPEVGSINLTILHNFLHVLLHQINLTNSKVEYRGDDATRLQTIISSLNTGPSVYLHEYSITDSEGNVTQRDHTPDTSIPAAEIYTTDSKSSIRKEKSSESTSSLPISEKNFETPVIKKTKGLKQKVGKGIEDNCQSIIFVEPIKDGLVPSALGFKKLNDTVEKLEQQFQSLEDLATNPEIIERIKTGRADPLNDMWSIININKRLDASEQGISKVMTLLQDVIKSEEKNSSPLKQNQDDDSNVKVPEESVNFNDRLTKLETDVLNINSEVEKLENLIDVKDKSDVSQQKPSEKNESSSDSGSEKLNEIKMKNLNMSEHSSTSSKTDDNEKINSETVDKSIASILSGSVTTACMLAVDKDKNNPSVSSITDDNESINSKTVGKSSLASVISGSVSSAHMLAADKNMNDPSISNETDDNEEINSKTDGKSSLARRISGSVTTAHMLAADKDKTQSHLSEHGSLDLHELKLDVETLKDEVAQTKQDVNKIRHQVKQLKADRGSPTDKNKKNDNTIDNNVASINELKSTDSGSSHLSVKHICDTDGLVQQQNYSANTAETSPSITSNTSLPGSKELDTTNNNFFTGNNRRKSKSMGVIGDSKKNHNESIKNLESRIAALERKIKVIDDPKNINQSNCVEEIQQLVASVNDIQNDIDKMKQSDAMYNEKEKHDVLIEQIELLKILKADKEDLEDALTEKADTDVVNRKVSYDRFQSTCYDITRNVEDAISKLTQQEKTWKVTLDNVQQEINNKLDRTELSPIEVFINNQLQVVHDKLEDLEEERRKNEAAGTKKILNDVSCISCNKNVTMRMDQGPIYKNNLSYNGNNDKPYLAYSMHRMKKQLKQFPGKNINQLTAAIQETRRKKTRRNNLVEKSSKEYFCNRYCGGSHTITTPQQRIMRTENYPVEWNPEILNPEILNTPRPNVCKPEKNVCCSAFNNQSVLTSINQHQSYEKFETATQQPQNHKEQKYRSSKISLGRQESKKNQLKQTLTESLNSKNILPTITDNKGALRVN